MQCVILAGGLGTRMRHVTGESPKTLVKVGGVPFAFYQLTWLAQSGIADVVYSIGFQGRQIHDYVGDGSRWGLRVRYVDDGKELCGTAGACGGRSMPASSGTGFSSSTATRSSPWTQVASVLPFWPRRDRS